MLVKYTLYVKEIVVHIFASHAKQTLRECGLDICHDPIKKGARIFRGSWYFKKRKSIRSWHFDCYVLQASLYLDDNPFVSRSTNGPGRKKLDLSLADRRTRTYLIVRGSQLRRDMRDTVDVGLPGYQERLAELTERYWVLAERLKEVGGVPKSWFL